MATSYTLCAVKNFLVYLLFYLTLCRTKLTPNFRQCNKEKKGKES